MHFGAAAEHKLRMLHRAAQQDDLQMPPNIKLTSLTGLANGIRAIHPGERLREAFLQHQRTTAGDGYPGARSAHQ